VIITQPSAFCRRRAIRGMLEIDMIVAIAIFAIAVMPVGYSLTHERKALRVEYFRSVAVEIVDGEMEILAAGDAKNYPDGSQNYPVHSRAAGVLPLGHFQLTKTGNHLRLEWNANEKHGIGAVVREFTLK
jgi:hypothetical protein